MNDSNGGLDLKAHIRTVPDFPVPGIRFRDITPLLASPEAYGDVIRRLADTYRDGRVDVWPVSRQGGSCSARPWPWNWRPVLCRFASPASCHTRPEHTPICLLYTSDAADD